MTNPLDNPELRMLVEQFDALLDESERVAAEVAQVDRTVPGITDQEMAEIEAYARSRQAPQELQELQRRVDAGEFSWNDVRSGVAMQDPAVVQALSSGVPNLQEAYTALREGQDVEDVIASRQPRDAEPRPPVQDRQNWEISAGIDDDDDWQPRSGRR
ncbi:hypothetical protein LZ318_19175 [Saccharopolyspora indica]|uniref:hypothetical protein n=1 Tax=Saccharopolyspora indica TaxID=1229659 RepID=UPI0022EB7894|nr:hypothetical protein [Saccharopolyspora indica]MDA3643163.1 hypothetical protein [Saccharopolyspora indica]